VCLVRSVRAVEVPCAFLPEPCESLLEPCAPLLDAFAPVFYTLEFVYVDLSVPLSDPFAHFETCRHPL
jgi:hypothetical protein